MILFEILLEVWSDDNDNEGFSMKVIDHKSLNGLEWSNKNLKTEHFKIEHFKILIYNVCVKNRIC